jgi:hypothetical protein
VALRIVIVLVLCGLAVAGIARREDARARAEPAVSEQVRAAGLRFAPSVAAGDRAWILAAVAEARPEAQRLIAEVDGLIEVRTHAEGGPVIGWAHMRPGAAVVSFDIASLNGDRALDRSAVVLHELGHVVDYVLVGDALVAELDRAIPRVGTCTGGLPVGPCATPEERFADTFAKWALRGRVSLAGSGYGIAAPPSLEDWGQELGLLAARLRVR